LQAAQKRHQEAKAPAIHQHQGHGPQVPPQPAPRNQRPSLSQPGKEVSTIEDHQSVGSPLKKMSRPFKIES